MYILELQRGWTFETRVRSTKSGHLCRCDRHLGKLNYAWQVNTDASVGEAGGQASLISCHIILIFLSIFTKSQASSPFEELNSAHLSKYQMDVRPSVQKRLRTMALSSVSKGDLDILSSCEMKDEPAFKELQGKPAFF